MRFRLGTALAAAVLATAGCDLDLTNPNSPPEETVLSTPDGIVALAVGMQSQYAGTGVGTGVVLGQVRSSALIADEWTTTTRALAADLSLQTGQGVDPSFGVVSGPFSASFRVVRSAEDLLANTRGVGLSQGTETGIIALAKTFKAMALGSAILQYERIPVTASLEANPLQPRAVVLDSVISLLESARTDLGGVTAPQLADFRARVQVGYDLGNVINAMLARYYLLDEQYQNAITAADRVNLGQLQTFTYPDPNRNPVWGYAYSLLYVQGRNALVTEADSVRVDSAGVLVTRRDARPAFWLRTDQAVATPRNVPARNLRQYENRNDPMPIFLPDEMRLIKAEAHTRLEQFAQARTLINQVRTQQSSSINEPVAALTALPVEALDTREELLRQIAYERRYELYMQGLRWEDLRRLGAFEGRTPKLQFLPLPQGECLYNPQNPCA